MLPLNCLGKKPLELVSHSFLPPPQPGGRWIGGKEEGGREEGEMCVGVFS